MSFDGFATPDWAKPYIGWVVGMDWPEGDEDGCFRLADACILAAHALVEGTGADLPDSRSKIGQNWDGEAHLAFARHVAKVGRGKVAALVVQLVQTAMALNNVGVQIQYAKYMIEATVWLLIIQIGYLLATAMISGGASLALIPVRLQLARLTVAQIAKRTALNIGVFAGIVAGMDAAAQGVQIVNGGRRDDLDGRQLAISALSGGAMGAMMGLLSGVMTRMATPALRAGLSRAEMSTAEKLLAAASSSIYGQAAQYALTGGLTTAGTLLAEGNFTWDALAKGITSSALGADGQHLAGPHLSPGSAPPSGLGPEPGPGHVPEGPSGARDPERPPQPPERSPLGPERSGESPERPAQPPDRREPGDGAGGRGVNLAALPDAPQRPGPVVDPGVPGRTSPVADPPPAGPASVPRAVPEQPGRGAEPPPATRALSTRAPEPVNRIDQLLNHGGPRPDTPGPRADTPGPRLDAPGPRPDGPAPRSDGPGPRPDGDGPRPEAGDRKPDAGDQRPDAPDQRPDAADQRPDAGEQRPEAPGSRVQDGETQAAAHTPETGQNTARVPFDFERFFNDPRWSAEATRFEQRLGAYYFNDPHTVDAARAAVGKLRDVLMTLTPRHEGESPAAFRQRVESAFFQDDAHTSAGQVGSGVTVDQLLAHGNLRELMTSFYNAAYFNHSNPGIFGKLILDIIDGNRWAEAEAVRLSVPELRHAERQLDTRVNRRILGTFDNDPFRFARDPFGTGNVVMLSERAFRDLAEVIQSQASRRDRTPAEQQRLGLITTPGDYDTRGAPLGRFERRFVESVTDGPLRADTPLPWREGIAYHDGADSRWARSAARSGFQVIDGVSATTTRMLTAAKFLDLGPGMNERFLGALMGWMLPGLDHSLFEILRGAQIADVGGMRLQPSARTTAVDLYRNLPGLDLGTLRREVLPEGMFPHEARYLDNALDPAGFSETQHHKVRSTADHLWPQLESGRVSDPALADWLRRNDIDPDDPAQVRALSDNLSRAHVMALTVYTRHSHYLINNVTRSQLFTGGLSDGTVHTLMDKRVKKLVDDYLGNLAAGTKALPLPLALRPVLHEGAGHLDSGSPLRPLAQNWIDAAHRFDEAKSRMDEHRAAGRTDEAKQAAGEARQARADQKAAWKEITGALGEVTPRLLDEMRWHADMVHDAMLQLPALGGADRPVQAFRGDWITPVYSPIYGSALFPHGKAREFLSVSRLLEVAIRFMSENPASDRKVLVVYQLTGMHARDISIFSSFAEDQEAVLPPHSRTRLVNDPELIARIREEAERTAADMVDRGVIPAAPENYKIIVMEEE
ncbi:hypothetical protein [Nonomuraea typhae]|uniref:WXG100-like domain-containing protein n=1 Tax=Nonomuraea typhae TaxID=2603600 RepID=UPI0012F88630|nr:hypothetical protein [Nonomuraea typhae]